MKTKLTIILLSLPILVNSQPVIIPNTLPVNAVVKLAWDYGTNNTPDIVTTNFYIYSGVISGQYTNRVLVGGYTNQYSWITSLRGVKQYLACTAVGYSTNASVGGNLESPFSNELTYTASSIGAPGLHPPVTLIVENSKEVYGPWFDTDMKWTLYPDEAKLFFKLEIVENDFGVGQAKSQLIENATHHIMLPIK